MDRIYHSWDKWECFKAGFYATTCQYHAAEARQMYASFLRDTGRFVAALNRVIYEWPVSCEQFLSNESINRVAWLGQAAMCIDTGVPACFRGGFNRLTEDEKKIANETAAFYLRAWLRRHGDASQDWPLP